MKELATSVMSFVFAESLYAGQQLAKIARSREAREAKNPPAPGPDGPDPDTFSGYLYRSTKRTMEKFGDPAAVVFIAGDEYQSRLWMCFSNVLSLKALKPSYWRKRWTICSLRASWRLMPPSATKKACTPSKTKNTRYVFHSRENKPGEAGNSEVRRVRPCCLHGQGIRHRRFREHLDG